MIARGAGVLALLLAAASGAAAQTAIRIGLGDDPDVLDPTLGRLASGRIVLNMVCDKLFDVSPDLKIVPRLATGHTLSPDGLQLTMTLRQGVKFHDGEPFTATAVKYGIDRHLTLPASFRKTEIEVIQKVEVVDEATVRLTLSRPSAALLSHFTDRAGMIVSPKAAEAMGEKFGTAPVCTGPFKFTERLAQDRITFERFADYWDKANIHVDRVVFTPIANGTVRAANLRAGQLDLIERVSPSDLATLKGDTRVKVVAVPELGYQIFMFNVGNGQKADNPFAKEPRLREALEAAIDRGVISQVVFDGTYVPGNQWTGPQNTYYDRTLPVPGRDVARAKALLQATGRERLSFNFLTANDPDWVQAAQVIQAMVGEAGFDMKIEIQENATRSKNVRAGNFETAFAFWSGRPDPDGNVVSHLTCKGPQNDPRYCNPEVDRLIDEAGRVADPAERKKLYDRMTAIVLRERPYLYLWHRSLITAHSAQLKGFVSYPDGIFRPQGWKLEPAS